MFQATLNENQKLIKFINSWNKSYTSLEKMQESQQLARSKTGLGCDNQDCSLSEASTQPHMDNGKYKMIFFYRARYMNMMIPKFKQTGSYFMRTWISIGTGIH